MSDVSSVSCSGSFIQSRAEILQLFGETSTLDIEYSLRPVGLAFAPLIRSAPPSPRGRGNILKLVPLPLGEGGAERRVRVEGLL